MPGTVQHGVVCKNEGSEVGFADVSETGFEIGGASEKVLLIVRRRWTCEEARLEKGIHGGFYGVEGSEHGFLGVLVLIACGSLAS